MIVRFREYGGAEEWARDMGAVPRKDDTIAREEVDGSFTQWKVFGVVWKDNPETVPWTSEPHVVVRRDPWPPEGS